MANMNTIIIREVKDKFGTFGESKTSIDSETLKDSETSIFLCKSKAFEDFGSQV